MVTQVLRDDATWWLFNGARILGPKTVAFMTNHLAEDSMLDSWGEKPTDDIGRPGFGFGLGFGLVMIPAMHYG